MDKKNIFISYSWDSEDHQSWTKSLADKLEEFFELHITFDQYDLDSYSDKNFFMEKAVFENDLILIIVTPEYVIKANNRLGGVGIETKLSISKHWEEALNGEDSNIIPILRKGTDLPNYLKEKFYIDFRKDSELDASFKKLVDHIKGTSKAKRPTKKHSIHKNPINKNLTRIEDFLKINHKKRRLVFDQADTTDFSANNRVKFELWETKSPVVNYYLFIFDNVTLKPTIQRFCELLKRDRVNINRLTILRSNRGEKGYLKKLFDENKTSMLFEEITFSDYIWEYCIDDDLKVKSGIYRQKFFIDQPLISLDDGYLSMGPAFEYLKKELNSDIQSPTNIIIAPGGTGKTTLCQYLASEYQDPDKAVSIFIQSEELRGEGSAGSYENAKIESVYDLYEIYSQVLTEQGNSLFTYDRTTFEVALITGRLVLIIDGMDEIISLFPESFDLDLFLDSIEVLSKQLASCKIVITSRNDVFNLPLMEKYEHLNKYYLLGFDEVACEKYLERRFRTFDHSEIMTKKVLAHIKPLIESDENQRVLPFVVDLLSALVEDSELHPDDTNFNLSFEGKNYESNEEITDYLVYSVLRRESQRQKIEIPMEDVLDIFLEISSTHKDHFSKDDLEDVVSIFCSENSSDLLVKLLRNPLISVDGNQCRFKYDFISDYFKSLFIINAINSDSNNEDFIKLIAKNVYGDNEVMAGTVKYYNNRQSEFFSHCKIIIEKIRNTINTHDVFSQNDTKFRAIAFLTKLASNMSGSKNSKESFTNILIEMFGNEDKLVNLSIYGDNKSLDLNNITVLDSRFVGYKSFPRSNFNNSRFKNCFFDSCFNEATSDGFKKEIFDSCRLGDLENAIESAEEKSEKGRVLIENELRNFLNSFFHRGSFTDKKIKFIKMSTRIKSINRAFLNKLVKNDILQIKIEKSDATYYMISPHYQDSVYSFLSNNRIDAKIGKIIQYIKQ